MRKEKPSPEPSDDDQAPSGIMVGLARVSTEDQNLEMQVNALIRAGVHPDHIHVEKASGVARKRPGRDNAVKDMRPGDTLVVWRLDRVGRSLRDLLDFMKMLDERGIAFKSLNEHFETSTPTGRVMLAVAGAFAQFERDIIAERTRAGVRNAKAQGKKFGQPPKVHRDNFEGIETALFAGEAVRDVAARYGMSEGCLRTWYPRARLDEVRLNGPRRHPPKQKRQTQD